jgi:hypothetical protein
MDIETVSIEWVVGLMRRHQQGGSYVEKSPYDAVATIVVTNGNAHIRACRGELSHRTARLLERELLASGVDGDITWERVMPDGSIKSVTLRKKRRTTEETHVEESAR